MRKFLSIMVVVLAMAASASLFAAASADPLPFCKFGQKNTKPCQWPPPTTTLPKGPHCIEKPIVKNGVLVCLTRGGGGFPHYVTVPTVPTTLP